MQPVKTFKTYILMFVLILQALLQYVSKVGVLPPLHFSPLKFLTNFSFLPRVLLVLQISTSFIRRPQIMRFLTAYYSPSSYYFLPLRSKIQPTQQGRRLRVASGATAPGPALEGAPRFRRMSLSSYILR